MEQVQFYGDDQVSLYDAVAERDEPRDRLAYPRADALVNSLAA